MASCAIANAYGVPAFKMVAARKRRWRSVGHGGAKVEVTEFGSASVESGLDRKCLNH